MASLLGPLMLVNADAALLLSNKCAAAGGRPRGLRDGGGRRAKPGRGHRQPGARRDRGHLPCRVRFAGRGGTAAPAGGGRQPGRAGAQRPSVPRRWRCSRAGRSGRASRHQTGALRRRVSEAAYSAAGVEAEVLPFIDDMARPPGRLRPDRLPRRRHHRQRAVRRRRRPCWCRWSSHHAHQRDNAAWMARTGAIHLPPAERPSSAWPRKTLRTCRCAATPRACWPIERWPARRCPCRRDRAPASHDLAADEVGGAACPKHHPRIHFVGVGGAGMTASPRSCTTWATGVGLRPGRASATAPARRAGVASPSATRRTSPAPGRGGVQRGEARQPEVIAARASIPVVPRAVMLAELMRLPRASRSPARTARPPPPRWSPACWPRPGWTRPS